MSATNYVGKGLQRILLHAAVCCPPHKVWGKYIGSEAMHFEFYISCEEVKYYIYKVAVLLARIQAWEGSSVI